MHAKGNGVFEPEPQGRYLDCYLGGVMALDGRLFGRQKDVEAGKKLVDGCIWTYKTQDTSAWNNARGVFHGSTSAIQ